MEASVIQEQTNTNIMFEEVVLKSVVYKYHRFFLFDKYIPFISEITVNNKQPPTWDGCSYVVVFITKLYLSINHSPSCRYTTCASRP